MISLEKKKRKEKKGENIYIMRDKEKKKYPVAEAPQKG